MLKTEFEKMVGRTISDTQYKAIELLYMASDMDKFDFAKSMKKVVLSIPENKKKDIKRMCVRVSGYRKTPNQCWFYIKYVELVDIDIKTGKYIVKDLESEDINKLRDDGIDLHLSGSYDMDYTECLDIKHKAIII
mgnify:CR=1 FL=1